MGSTRVGGLSPRETQVIRLAARGAPVRAIAAALDLSPNTVKTHLRWAAEKLGTVRREEALRRAAAVGLPSLPCQRAPLACGRQRTEGGRLRLALRLVASLSRRAISRGVPPAGAQAPE